MFLHQLLPLRSNKKKVRCSVQVEKAERDRRWCHLQKKKTHFINWMRDKWSETVDGTSNLMVF